jgi:hypothetical protein
MMLPTASIGFDTRFQNFEFLANMLVDARLIIFIGYGFEKPKSPSKADVSTETRTGEIRGMHPSDS